MPLRRLPKSTRISPMNTNDHNIDIDKEFEIIEKFFWITGIIFTRTGAFCTSRGILIAFLDVIFSIFYVYITIANFYLAAAGSPNSSGHAFINAFANFSSVCVRFILLVKRRQIRKSIGTMSKLNKESLELKESINMKRYIFGGCSLAILIPLAQMVIGVLTEDSSNKYEFLFLFGIPAPKSFSRWIHFAVIAFRIANVLLCKSLPFLVVILCTFIFTRLRDINLNFLARVKTSIDSNSLQTLFDDYTVFYGRITKMVEIVEDSLSLVSFFTIGYILSCIFSVTSYLVSNKALSSRELGGILYQLITFVEIVTCFLILSMRAASVNESAVEVKNTIHTLPSKQSDLNPNLTATLLQLANNFAGEVCMTGWGLFVINRGFILTTAGVVVSYGVILVQLGK